jgi:hypothetical protein
LVYIKIIASIMISPATAGTITLVGEAELVGDFGAVGVETLGAATGTFAATGTETGIAATGPAVPEGAETPCGVATGVEEATGAPIGAETGAEVTGAISRHTNSANTPEPEQP